MGEVRHAVQRSAVVIAPHLKHQIGLCTIVPLSTTAPVPVEPFHHRMDRLAARSHRGGRWHVASMAARSAVRNRRAWPRPVRPIRRRRAERPEAG